MTIVIKTEELTKQFGDFTAVDALSMEIREGEICAFLGPNGAGKTTLIRMLCGILEPSSGSARIFDLDLMKESEIIKTKIAYMSQKFSLYEELTVRENLSFYAGLYGISGRERRTFIDHMIEMVALNEREGDLAGLLSMGLRQRLALGCAMIARPRLLFLDEPTSGVSPGSRKKFFSLIQNLANEGKTVIVSTHFMDEAERCNKVAFLSEGKLIAHDSPENLKENTLQGILVEIKLESFMDRLAEIEALPYVKECIVRGERLHILLQDAGRRAVLEEALGVEAHLVRPGLEEVFIALAREKRSET